MVGDRIRKYKELKGMKSKEFAELIGIAPSTLSAIESGKTKPNADTLAAIVIKTNIDPYYLLTGEEKIVRPEENELLDYYRFVPQDKKAPLATQCRKGAFLTYNEYYCSFLLDGRLHRGLDRSPCRDCCGECGGLLCYQGCLRIQCIGSGLHSRVNFVHGCNGILKLLI